MPINITVFRLVMELVQLIVSSRILVLGEVDIAFGNILGSNLFNTLVVVGIAGAIHPLNRRAGGFQSGHAGHVSPGPSATFHWMLQRS